MHSNRGLLRLLLSHSCYGSSALASVEGKTQQLLQTLTGVAVQHQQRLLHHHPGLSWQLCPRSVFHDPPLPVFQRTVESSQSHSHSHCRRTCSSDAGSQQDPAATERAGRDLAIIFTCAKCDTRAMKAFSRQAYERGVVLITCPGCQSLHLIADHLGWFGDSGFKVDEYLQEQGQQVKRVSLDNQPGAAAQLTAEDLTGWSKVQQLLTTVATAASGSKDQASGGCCGGNSNSNSGDSSSSSSGDGSSSSSSGSPPQAPSDGVAGDAAIGTAGDIAAAAISATGVGVLQVAPEDVEAWVRVQKQSDGDQQS